MAELLIRSETDPYPCRPWKRGDIVEIHDDGYYDSSPNDRNIVIKITGKSVDELTQYLEVLNYDGTYSINERRRWRISDTVINNVIAAGRIVTLPLVSVQAGLIDKKA